MILRSLLAALAAIVFAAGAHSAQSAPSQKNVDPVKVLEEWLAHTLGGHLDVSLKERTRGKVHQVKSFVSVKRGFLDEQQGSQLTHESELRQLCAAVAERGGPDAAATLLKVASVGADQRTIAAEMVPALVRSIAEDAAGKLAGEDAIGVLRATAGAAEPRSGGRQRAALRILARHHAAASREVMESGLDHGSAELRAAAAEALAIARLPASFPAQAAHLETEADERVAAFLVEGLTATVVAAAAQLDEAALNQALDAAVAAFERHGWRYQLAALDLFLAVRSPRTVPVLIDVLADAQGKADGDRDSRLVPQRAYAVLRNLTGAVFAQDKPAQWQAWWEANRGSFAVAPSAEKLDLAREERAGETSATAFFGIPIAGSRIAFVVDISGSMHFPLVRRAQTGDGGSGDTKWKIALQELRGAIEALGPDRTFHVVFFNAGAEAWKPRPVAASPANKKAFLAHLAKVNPDGGTNVWAGLELALQPKSSDPMARLGSDIDELFVLSDGLPSAGDVLDPRHILQTVRALNEVNRVRINTVYIGGDEEAEQRRSRGPRWDMTGPEFMQQLATENGGTFLHK